jgi:hypothetical protein
LGATASQSGLKLCKATQRACDDEEKKEPNNNKQTKQNKQKQIDVQYQDFFSTT